MKFSKKELIILIFIVILIIIGYFGSKYYLNNKFDYYIVEGDSMIPNIQDNSEIKIDKYAKVKRYDVVVIDMGDHKIIKRVIGVPGDTLKFTSDDKLFINNEEIEYPFEILGTTKNIEEEIILDYQFYYVLGDNREDAYDSRSFGKVSKSQIVGVVVDIKNPQVKDENK